MEIRRYELPVSHRPRRPARNDLLEAISTVLADWRAAGRDHVVHRYKDGRVEHHPAFRAEIAAELDRIRQAERLKPPEPEPMVEEVVGLPERLEDDRLVRRAIVRWSDGTIGEALAWYAGTARIEAADLPGRTAKELDLLLLWRLARGS